MFHVPHHVHHTSLATQILTQHPKFKDHGKQVRSLGKFSGPKVKCFFFVLGSGLSLLALTVAGLRLGDNPIPGHDMKGSIEAVPYTSELIPIFGLYCDAITLAKDTWDGSAASKAWNSTVYLLSEKPKLFKEYSFDVTNDGVDISNQTWYMRHVSLYAGSSFTVNSCVIQKASEHYAYTSVCVLYGRDKYLDWIENRICSGVNFHLPYCSRSNSTDSSFIVSEDTAYYFVHSTNSSEKQKIKVNVSISSLDYAVQSANILSNCSLTHFDLSCTVENIKLDFKGYALVATEEVVEQAVVPWTWEDTLHLSWSCESSFTGYVLVVFLPMMAFVVLCCTGCCCCAGCRILISSVKTKRSHRDNNTEHSRRKVSMPSSEAVQLHQVADPNVFKKRCKIVGIIMLINLTVFIVPLMTFFTGILPIIAYNTPSGLTLSAGDTYEFPINKFICSSLTLDITNGSSRLAASFYLIDDSPSLSEHRFKSLRDTKSCSGNRHLPCYSSWRAYLHEGSVVNILATCEEGTAYFSQFYDDDSYANFVASLSSSIQNAPITQDFRLSSSIQNAPITQDFRKVENKLGTNIFVLVLLTNSSANISLEFNLTEYSTAFKEVACEMHSYTTTHCKIPISYGVGSMNGLLKVTYDGEEPANSIEYITVDTNCEYRASSWTALWLPSLFVNAAVIYTIYLCLHEAIKKLRIREIEKKQKQQQEQQQQQQLHDPATEESHSLETPPASQDGGAEQASSDLERQPLLLNSQDEPESEVATGSNGGTLSIQADVEA